ncbi:hypothetical protein ALQ56_200328 [Pseudomonas syringae pv. papulans]|nr:hypothetical protein ALQ56_200328 [Pseudomonas syringae pv. papulans]
MNTLIATGLEHLVGARFKIRLMKISAGETFAGIEPDLVRSRKQLTAGHELQDIAWKNRPHVLNRRHEGPRIIVFKHAC